MTLQWIEESPAYWDADKARIVGHAPVGIFDVRYQRCEPGEILPATWWRVESSGKIVGYGWLDVVWGDAEILLATDPEARGQGVGTFIIEQLEAEAKKRGVNYLYNIVRPTHPDREAVASWLVSRGFEESEDGSLFRAIAHGPAAIPAPG